MSHFQVSASPDGGAAELGPGEPCADCKTANRPVSWSPSFAAWLCHECRDTRTRTELWATEKANADADALAARLASGQAAGDK